MSTAKKTAKDGEYRVFCPFCHHTRKKHPNERELWINVNSGYYECHHCGIRGRIDTEEFIARNEQWQASAAYRKVKLSDMTAKNHKEQPGWKTPRDWKSFHEASLCTPSEVVMDYLTGVRGLTEETVEKLGIGGDKQYFSGIQAEADCVVFNYYLDGGLVCQKMRTVSGKDFLRSPGCRSIPYNIDSLRCDKDEQGRRGRIFITEGEMDVASLTAAGFDRVISIPNGAQAGLDWLEELWDSHFDGVTDYCLAVDNDDAGNSLAARLAERLGPVACSVVRFGEGCKDANEHLLRYGIDSLRETVNGAKPYPLPNVVTQDDLDSEMEAYFSNGADQGMKTGWTGGVSNFDKKTRFSSLDDIVTWQTKQLCLITGRAGDGKSEFVDELVVRLMMRNDLRCVYFTPENTPLRRHVVKICEKVTSKSFPKRGVEPTFTTMTREEMDEAREWSRSRICYINSDGGEMKVGDILSAADNVVKRYGVNIMVVDPFNYIEKEIERESQVYQWESKVISEFRRFAVERGLLIFLVAHPRKVYENDKNGERRRIEMYDISGTADFANKADYCFVVDRSRNNGMTTIYVDKVRNKDYGNKGRCYFLYNRNNGRFSPCWRLELRLDEDRPSPDELAVPFDTTNWLHPAAGTPSEPPLSDADYELPF